MYNCMQKDYFGHGGGGGGTSVQKSIFYKLNSKKQSLQPIF